MVKWKVITDDSCEFEVFASSKGEAEALVKLATNGRKNVAQIVRAA